jgi:peroxiredoxin Q/BCP
MRINAKCGVAMASLLATLSIGWGAESAAPKVGDLAPLVEGKDQAGGSWRLAEEVGKKAVLLYFYPKDDTPGCTKQACGLRDQMADLNRENVRVVGVSFDSPESHQKFIGKYRLNFSLISDPEGKIAESYGARTAGRNMARRVSFLIGLDGRIVHLTDTPSADTHLAEMKEAVNKLNKK